MEQPIPRFDLLVGDLPAGSAFDAIGFDTKGLGAWDSSLLVFLLRGRDYCEAHDLVFRAETLPDDVGRLLRLTRAVPEREAEREEEAGSLLARLGGQGVASYEGLMASIAFLGEVGSSFARLLRFRIRLRWRDFWVVVQSNSSGALPIVTLISFSSA